MSYSVKEIFYSLQGEGAQSGRPAVFCRFTGCNLWTGRESDRRSAVCNFCDTDFVGTNGKGGGVFQTAETLADAVDSCWPNADCDGATPLVILTGGEPLLQLDDNLIVALRNKGFSLALETNGTLLPPEGIDWICVSPKAASDVVLRSGHELKLIYPQETAPPQRFDDWDFEYFFLQPMDGQDRDENTRAALAYCLKHPKWRLSLQTHKLLGIE